MADATKSGNLEPKRKFNKDLLLWGIAMVFIVAAIAAMVAIDVIADAKMGGAHPVQDAAEK